MAMEGVAWLPFSDLIWLVAVDYDQTRMEFGYMSEAARSLSFTSPELISFPQIKYAPCVMRTHWGTIVETRTLSDLTKFGAKAPDVIIVCEPGQVPEEALPRFYERLSERRGLLLLGGTFEDSQTWMAKLWGLWRKWPNEDGGKSFSAPTWCNTHRYPGGRNDPEIKRMYHQMGRALFLERCGGTPVQPTSLVFHGRWRPQLHVQGDLAYNEDLGVEIAVDPGYNPSHYVVEFIQQNGQDVYLIDEIDCTGVTHPDVIQRCVRHQLWPKVQGGVIDPWAGGSHLVAHSSPVEVWWKECHTLLRSRVRIRVEAGIERLANQLMGPDLKPHLFVSPRCQRFIWEMNHWRRKKGSPTKDNCDALKAVAYWVADRFSFSLSEELEVKVSDFTFGGKSVPGLDDLDLTEAELELLEPDLAGRSF